MSQTLLAKLYSSGGKTIARIRSAYAWLEFARADRPNHAFARPSTEMHTQLRGSLDENQLAARREMATSFKQKLEAKYDFAASRCPMKCKV